MISIKECIQSSSEFGCLNKMTNCPPIFIDIQIVLIWAIFLLPIFVFILILPGVRRSKVQSAFTFLTSMAVGMAILLCIFYPGWMTIHGQIASNFQANSHKRIHAEFRVNIGLNGVNISLWDTGTVEIGKKIDSQDGNNFFESLLFNDKIGMKKRRNASKSTEIQQFHQQPQIYDYNEHFELKAKGIAIGPLLQRGMPLPLLKIVEYFDTERTGFLWGHQCAFAGYWACISLWFAFALWSLQMLSLIFVPHHFGKCSFCCGIFMLLSNLIYLANFPKSQIGLFSGIHPSICFYTILAMGFLNCLIGFVFWAFEHFAEGKIIRLEPFFTLRQESMPLDNLEGNKRRWTAEGRETEKRPRKKIFVPDWKFNWPINERQNDGSILMELSLNECDSVSSFVI